MPDKRELMLDRINDILLGIRGVTTVVRNVDEMPESGRPCIALIDGDETRSDTAQAIGMQPVIMVMSPIIAIGVSSSPSQIGSDANALRAKILPAILGDAQLTSLMGKNGRISYDRADGKLSHGSLMACDLQLVFSIYYPLDPSDLQ